MISPLLITRSIRISISNSMMAMTTILARKCRQLKWTVRLFKLLVLIILVTVAQEISATVAIATVVQTFGWVLGSNVPTTTRPAAVFTVRAVLTTL